MIDRFLDLSATHHSTARDSKVATETINMDTGEAHPIVNMVDVLDAFQTLPPARDVVNATEVRVPVPTKSGATVLVTFRCMSRPAEAYSLAWWQPLGL